MTWRAPRNIKDNTVITAYYWNSILGSDGSVLYLDRKTNQRRNCTVFSAPFRQIISPSALDITRINAFSVVPRNRQVTNRRYFNKNTGAIQLPDNTPVLMFWRMTVSQGITNYTMRTTLELERRRRDRLDIETVAAEYFFRNHADSNAIVGVYASVSWNKRDRYFLTVNHNAAQDLTVDGVVTIIVNPSFV